MPADDFKSKISIDVTDWKTGIDIIRRDNRLIESGFKTVAAGLDNWRDSSEGLSARQEALNKKIANQKEIVSALEKEYKKIADEYGETSYEAENFAIKLNKEKTELAKNEKELRNVSGALDNLDKDNKDASKSTEELGEKQSALSGILRTSGAALLGVGAAAATIGAAFIMTGDESKSALNDIQAATGASKEEMEMYKSVMDGVVSSNFGDGFEDVAHSIGLVQQQVDGLDPGQLESFVENSYLLEDTFGMDIQENIRGVNALVKEFGLTNDEAFNLMAQGAQKGLNQNNDLADLMSEYAPLWASLGFSAEETFNALANGSKEGAYHIDFLNDAVKEFGIRTKDNSTLTRQAFEDLGFDADAMTTAFANGGDEAREAFTKVNEALFALEDSTKRNEIGVALYGTKYEDLEEDAVRALTNVQGEIALTTDALSAINEVKYDSIGDNISLLKNQMSVLLSGGDIDANELGNTITTILNKAIEILKTTLPSVATALISALPGILDQLISFVASSIPQLIDVVVGVIPKIISSLLKAVPKLIGMLATIIVNVLNALSGMLPDIINEVVNIIPEIVSALLEAIPLIVQAGIDLLSALVDALPEIIANITAILPEIINGIIDAIITLIPMIMQAGINLFTSLVDALPEIITAIVEIIPILITSIVEGFTEYLPVIIEAWLLLFTSVIEALPEIIVAIVEVLPTLISSIIDALITLLPMMIEAGITLFMALIKALPQIIVGLVTALPQIISAIIQALVELLPEIITAGIDLFVALIKELPTIIAEIIKAVPEIIEALVEAFGGMIDSIIQIGTDLVSGIWNGISDAAAWICEKIKGFGETVLDAIKGIFGIASPSKKTHYFGEMLGEGVAGGIDASLRKVLASAKNMTTKTLEALSAQTSALKLSQDVNVTRNVVGIDEPSINAINSIISTQSASADSRFMSEVLAILKTMLLLMQSGANITDSDILRALDLAYKKRGIVQGGLV